MAGGGFALGANPKYAQNVRKICANMSKNMCKIRATLKMGSGRPPHISPPMHF